MKRIPKSVLFKGLRTALFVGTVLTLINQWGALFADQTFRWIPCLLTYLVPFCVFIYSYLANQPKSKAEPTFAPDGEGKSRE